MIVLLGAPGSGKSVLAAVLAARYGWFVLAKDEFKEILLDVLGSTGTAWSRRLSDASFALLFAQATRLLRAGLPLLLEGNFRAGEHEPALQELLAPGVALAQIRCEAPLALRQARLAARAHDATRHRGHADDPQLASLEQPQFLQLPGARLTMTSSAEITCAAAAVPLCAALDAWLGSCASLDR